MLEILLLLYFVFIYFRFRFLKTKLSDKNEHCVNLNSRALINSSKVHPTFATSINSPLKFNKQAKLVWDT